MVGESVAIDRPLIVAPGLPSAIFRVFFHQEGFVHHPALPHPWQQRSAHEDVVEACPPTLIPVGARAPWVPVAWRDTSVRPFCSIMFSDGSPV